LVLQPCFAAHGLAVDLYYTLFVYADYPNKFWVSIVNLPSLSLSFSMVTVPKVALFDFLLAADIVSDIN
jgi:hypothetical protein